MENTLFYSIFLIMLDIFLWRTSRPKNSMVKLLLRLVNFLFFSWAMLSAGISPLAPPLMSDSYLQYIVAHFLGIFWWFSVAILLSLLFNLFFQRNKNARDRFLHDVVNAILFIAATWASLTNIMDFSIRGMVATSGVLAVVLGLAIQSSLNDVFSGIVLNATSPCQIGDWVKIDTTEGKVVDINWRATHLMTAQGNVAIIPNSIIAKTKIINNNRPSKVHGVSVVFDVAIEERPAMVFSALNNALIGTHIVLKDPKPFAMIKSSSANSFQYEVSVFVDEVEKKRAMSNTLYDLCHRHLSAAGLELRTLGIPVNNRNRGFNHKEKLLSYVTLFQLLNTEEINFLINGLTYHFYAEGEVVLIPSERVESLVVVASGVISVEHMQDTHSVEFGRLSPGDSLGEESILAGIPMNITAKALVPSVIYRVDKNMITALLKKYKDSGQKMCQALSQKTSVINSIENSSSHVLDKRKRLIDSFLSGMEKFHKL
ncbi:MULTISPECIES: mechanosensitive ion channel family protein [unclassified Serratia (in: enterobacteria)]|uniref:mechanosensitive ion channel family protein n=1 Tax=unclassified Serratia (in: enterobacteria) TaxID=2647522 RepID=UPI003075FE8E